MRTATTTTLLGAAAASVALGIPASTAHAGLIGSDTETFLVPIANINEVFFLGNGFIPRSNDFAGGTVIDARLSLTVSVVPTAPEDTRVSDAANFNADVIVPVDILPDAAQQLTFFNFTGDDFGWSGTGVFSVEQTLDELIGGTWESPVFYSASTYPGVDAENIIEGEVIVGLIFITVQIPAPGAVGVLAGAGLLAARRGR